MCGFGCGVATTVAGAVLVVVVSTVGYLAVPSIIDTMIENNVVLIEDTIQFERFEVVPVPLTFSVNIWNITNEEEVLAGGVPIVNEVGPYVYKIYQRREISRFDEEFIYYHIIMDFEFDAEASFPHTEDDVVTVVNVGYHAILQVAEAMFPNQLMSALAAGLNGVFGAENNRPIARFRTRDLLFDGIKICDNPGLIGAVVCSQIRQLSADAQNIEDHEDGGLIFTLLRYRDGRPSQEYKVHRGVSDSSLLGIIDEYGGSPHFLYWMDGEEGRGSGSCNMINGTDSAIFPPFVDTEKSIWAINTDICRSVELRYQYDTEYEGIPLVRFSANDWFLDNNEGCFCLNLTNGINRGDGCLLTGTMEMYTCLGAFLVLTYPHFLYADPSYRNGIIGANPVEDDHRIFVDLEPNTGTVVRGQKRAQFNIFMRPVTGISATQNLRTTLTPIVWIEEGMSLPEEFVDELKTKLLLPLNLVNILIPVLIAITALVFTLGLFVTIRAKRNQNLPPETAAPPPKPSSLMTN